MPLRRMVDDLRFRVPYIHNFTRLETFFAKFPSRALYESFRLFPPVFLDFCDVRHEVRDHVSALIIAAS
jgi:hypothetical protein